MIIPLSISLVALCFFFTAHITIWHYELIKARNVALIIKISLFVYVFVICLGVFFLKIKPAGHIWVSCPLYMVFIMVYLHFYLGVDRSVSIRILGELYKAKDRRMDFGNLQLKYPKEYMIKHRIELLVKNNYLIRGDETYSCTTKGRSIAKFNLFLKKLYLLEITG